MTRENMKPGISGKEWALTRRKLWMVRLINKVATIINELVIKGMHHNWTDSFFTKRTIQINVGFV